MSINVSSSQTNPFNGLLLDITEAWDGFSANNVVAINGRVENRGSGNNWAGNNGTPVAIYQNVVTGPTMIYDPAVGCRLASFVSGAVRNMRLSAVGGDFMMVPVYQRFEPGANTIPAGARSRPNRRYTLDNPMRITVVGTAVVECGIGFGNAATPSGGASPFAVWSSDPAVNAGRWLPRYRRVQAGGITNGPDSGITAANWHKLSIRYTEGPVPTIEWLVDDSPFHIQSGDANMIQINLFAEPMLPFQSLSTPAGTTMQAGAARFRVQEV